MANVPRIYVPGRLMPGPMTIEGEPAQRLSSVMRPRDGDEFRVFSGDGREWRATFRGARKSGVQADLGEVVRHAALPPVVLEVWCALVRPARFDWAIEKCVEAGADVIRPLLTEHGARGDGSSESRHNRWERIAIEATEQCGRLHVPVIEKASRLDELLGRHHGTLVVADASGGSLSEVRPLLPERGRLAVAVGPEGGWSEEELGRARAAGGLLLALGPHILRTETAAVVATALLRAG
jgi:16S rRNA (uracil1498-N3)-methyltransferase